MVVVGKMKRVVTVMVIGIPLCWYFSFSHVVSIEAVSIPSDPRPHGRGLSLSDVAAVIGIFRD